MATGMAEGIATGIAKGMIEGKAEGMATGEIKGKLGVARNMFSKGMSFNDVLELTGLRADELKGLTESPE
jgi:predicted transposase/invertase (TIGR01784 family)